MRSLWVFALWPLLLPPAAVAAALTAAEQAMLTELLGEGVVGAPVAASR